MAATLTSRDRSDWEKDRSGCDTSVLKNQNDWGWNWPRTEVDVDQNCNIIYNAHEVNLSQSNLRWVQEGLLVG